ncbi:MAG TPA: cytochrome c3 family protein [Candidatus Acidoferrales bacterium]|nr:cytochrome c3 family protein [Candidatus Acidoferrales bacterium]
MAQIFHPSTNTISRVSLFSALFLIAFLLWLLAEVERSSYVTEANVEREQPVQFSHKHHVADDGIDCRYCHTSVETSAFAGIPPTKTCMNCHSQIFRDSPYLEPIRESFRTGKPIEWTRVHQLADFVYFDHSIHVNKGVGCATCHGRVDQMPLVRQVVSLQMEWCLGCHREPERYLRPGDQIFNMAWQPPPDQIEQGRQLAKGYKIRSVEELTSCSTCHR